jgi:hypothetical protein
VLTSHTGALIAWQGTVDLEGLRLYSAALASGNQELVDLLATTRIFPMDTTQAVRFGNIADRWTLMLGLRQPYTRRPDDPINVRFLEAVRALEALLPQNEG